MDTQVCSARTCTGGALPCAVLSWLHEHTMNQPHDQPYLHVVVVAAPNSLPRFVCLVLFLMCPSRVTLPARQNHGRGSRWLIGEVGGEHASKSPFCVSGALMQDWACADGGTQNVVVAEA